MLPFNKRGVGMGMGTAKPVWIAANALAAAVFLLSASRFWIEPELADIPGASAGDAFVWGVQALPIAAFFVLANLGWLLLSLLPALRGRPTSAMIAALLLAAWVVTLFFDNAHHAVGS